jgi:transposase-like protein
VTTTESAELRKLSERNKLLEQENEILRRAAAYFAKSRRFSGLDDVRPLAGRERSWPARGFCS